MLEKIANISDIVLIVLLIVIVLYDLARDLLLIIKFNNDIK